MGSYFRVDAFFARLECVDDASQRLGIVALLDESVVQHLDVDVHGGVSRHEEVAQLRHEVAVVLFESLD